MAKPPTSSSSAYLLDGIASAVGIPSTVNPVDAAAETRKQKRYDDLPHDVGHHKSLSIKQDEKPANKLPPCQAIPIEFRDICYDVKVLRPGARSPGPIRRFLQGVGLTPPENTETLRVLHGLSGRIPHGELCALMGASGAGKSTLLNMLSGRAAPTSGQVTFAGVPASPEAIAGCSAFVQQLDLFLINLTPEEHLSGQVKLRLPSQTSAADRKDILEELLIRMNLVKCRGNQIAVQHGAGGISGGEKKRLNVASEIITTPSILFADEPTTGLDSYMALSIVDVLRTMADSGRTVIATVHQPSSKIFELFSQLVLLGEGRLLYCGPRDGCVAWFQQLGHTCPPTTNPADFVVKIAAMPEGDEARAQKLETIDRWAQQWAEEGEQFVTKWEKEGRKAFNEHVLLRREKEMSELLNDGTSTFREGTSSKVNSFMLDRENSWLDAGNTQLGDQVRELFATCLKNRQRPSWMQQVGILYWRAMQSNKRDRLLLHARAGQTLIMALLYSTLTFRVGWDYAGTRSRAGVAYSAILNQSMMGAMGVVNTFGTEIPIVKREYESGILSPSAYIIAKMLADAPIQIVFPIIFVTILHWVSGARDDFVRFLAHVGSVLLVSNTAMSLGYFASCVTTNPEVGPIVVNLTTLPINLFGGFMVKISNTPVFLRWIQWLSFVRYGFSVSLNILFGGNTTVTLVDGSTARGSDWINAEFEVNTKQTVLYVWILVIMLVALRVITCFTFTILLRKKKENS